MSSFDDETWERELFARRAVAEAAGPRPALDVDDVLARVDEKARRARVFDVARVLTLANAFAAAAACLALVRGGATENTRSPSERDDGPNMTMSVPAAQGGPGALACRLTAGVRLGELACASAPTDERLSSSMTTSSLAGESLSCTDEVTCGAVGP